MSRMVINEIELHNQIQKMILFMDQEEEKLKQIKKTFLDMSNDYSSNNANLLEKDNINFFHNFDILVENRKKYVEVMKKNIENYQEMANNTTRFFQNGKK